MTREEAISIIEERIRVTEYVESSYVDCVDIEALRIAIKALSDVPDTNVGDTISRQAAIYIASGYCHPADIASELAKLSSAQPDPEEFEWCSDCKEYDKERHCCPRYNRVIRDAVEEAKEEQRWIPCSERLPDKECFALVTVNDGAIYTDLSLFRNDGRFIEHTGDVIAWMPLPEPWREEDNEP